MLGSLLNTRGLMELIIINVGLELRVISPTLFSMMVVMALTTTALTAPLLHFFRSRQNPEGAPDLLKDEIPPTELDLDGLTRPAAPAVAEDEGAR